MYLSLQLNSKYKIPCLCPVWIMLIVSKVFTFQINIIGLVDTSPLATKLFLELIVMQLILFLCP